MTNPDFINQYRNIMGLGKEPLAFPKTGGAYDSRSLLIYTKVQGNRTYKDRLDRFVIDLAKDLMKSASQGGLKLKVKRIDLEKALLCLVHTFAHVASVCDRYNYVSLSLNKNDYDSARAQFKSLSYPSIREAVDLLTKCVCEGNEAYVIKKPGTYDKASKSGLRTRLEPTTAFLNQLTQTGLVFWAHPNGFKKNKTDNNQSLLQLSKQSNDGKTKKVQALGRDLNQDEAVLVILNKKLKALRIDFSFPEHAAYNLSWNYKSRTSRLRHMSGNQLSRRFTNNDGDAGRLYGHWVQQCPSNLRDYLTFNGTPTIELDFSSMQLYLLYGMADVQPPPGDLYGFDRIDRYWMKSVLTKSVGAKTRDEAIAALRAEMKDTANKLLKKAEEYFDIFWDFHSAVYDLLFHGQTWARLQYFESTIALRVLKQTTEAGIICIPIHDSFIVQSRHKCELETAMLQAFQSVFPGLQPTLK